MAKKHLEDEDMIRDATGFRIRYQPWGVTRDLFEDHDDEILVAGPAGTGKSLGILQKIHLVLSKYSGAKAFMSRKTRTSMTNSCIATFNERVLRPPDRVTFHGANQVYNYPNGSEFAVIGLDDPERIKSTDWDLGYIQEVTECEENDWEICTTRLRHWVVPYQQMIGDCNPDKPTHWMKKRTEKEDPATGRPITKMLLSKHEDNPRLFNHFTQEWTPQGIAYLNKLKRLSGVRRARLFSGQWVAAEGVIYDTWDPQKHIINIKDLPTGWEMWPHFWAIDWGFIHPFVWGDYIEDPITGNLYLLQEIYRTKRIVEDHAAHIMELTKGFHVPQAIICDHDAGDRATFERHTGYLTLPAYKSIGIGIQAVQKRLTNGLSDKPEKAVFYVRDALVEVDKELEEAGLPTCTIDEFDGYVWDKRENLVVNSKKDELPIDKDNHGMDKTRYMIAFADNLADDPEDFEDTAIFEDEVHISSW